MNEHFQKAIIGLRQVIAEAEDDDVREMCREVIDLILEGVAHHERRLGEIRRWSQVNPPTPPSPYGDLPYRAGQNDSTDRPNTVSDNEDEEKPN